MTIPSSEPAIATSNVVLVAVDGTNSRSSAYSGGSDEDRMLCFAHESFTQQFARRLVALPHNKKFLHGPHDLGGSTGLESTDIEREAWEWLRLRLRSQPDARVVLVGHSRGGHIVNHLAIRLSRLMQGEFVVRMSAAGSPPWRGTEPQLVHFLGLYDAVDMTFALGDTSAVPANVTWCYHAIRDESLGSRAAWGNTATGGLAESQGGGDHRRRVMRRFFGTHGSLGGAVAETCEGGLDRDLGGATAGGALIGFAVGGPAGALIGGGLANRAGANVVGSCSVELSEQANRDAGARANEWIMEGARRAGLRFSES